MPRSSASASTRGWRRAASAARPARRRSRARTRRVARAARGSRPARRAGRGRRGRSAAPRSRGYLDSRSRTLRLVHRLVSDSEQLLRLLPAAARRDPEARVQRADERVDVGLHGVDDPRHDLTRLLLACFPEEQRELVASDPESAVVAAHELLEQGAELLEHAVADHVPVKVVDLLEVVEIEEDEREGPVLLTIAGLL